MEDTQERLLKKLRESEAILIFSIIELCESLQQARQVQAQLLLHQPEWLNYLEPRNTVLKVLYKMAKETLRVMQESKI